MKKSRRWISAVVAAVMTCSVAAVALSGCGKKPEPEAPTYTYNEYISRFPSSWSTHNAQSDADMYVQKYTEMGLYAYSLSDDKTTFKFVDEMAVGNPVNVTSTYKGQYGITDSDAENTKAGKAWEITLNPDATWENGTAITADDYVWSMERVLSSEMKNNRATNYTVGETAIYGARDYYYNGRFEEYIFYPENLSDEEVNAKIEEGSIYFSLKEGKIVLGVLSFMGFHNLSPKNPKHFYEGGVEDPSKRDWLLYLDEKYSGSANAYGYIKLTKENLDDVKTAYTIFSTNLQKAASSMKKYMPHWTRALSYCSVIDTHAEYPIITGTKTDEELNALVSDGKLFFSLTKSKCLPNGGTLESLYTTNPEFFYQDKDMTAENAVNYYEELKKNKANSDGYINITADNLETVKTGLTVLKENLGEDLAAWYNVLSVLENVKNDEVPFSNVGFVKTGDYKFVIVFKNALSLHQVKDTLTNNWLVYKDYYTNGYSKHGDLTLTSYGTTSGQYMGYGPYKLKNFEVDKQLVFERNENWYGYKSDKTNYHANEYQTDKIVCKILSDPATALLEFQSGNLDNVILSANDTDKYKFSDYMLKRTGSNTWTITLNSNLEKLGVISDASNGENNVRILSVPEFRKALSLSINRNQIAQNIVAGANAAFTFINNNYYYDLENDPDSVYRNTPQAKKAVVDLYNIEYGEDKKYKTLNEAYASVTGFDIDAAKENFIAAYEKAKQSGIYNDGENVKISIYTTSLTQKFTAMINYIDQQVKAATAGTSLEGKVTIDGQLATASTVASDMKDGKITGRYYSYAGDYANPNGMIANFTDSASSTLQECGFDPANEAFEITADFDGDGTVETLPNTYDGWQKSIAAGGVYATASNEVKLEILSALEYNLLKNFRTIPLCVIADVTLRSKKVNYATENANIFVAYGGVRLMTYNYSDAEWAEFCKNSNNLKYD